MQPRHLPSQVSCVRILSFSKNSPLPRHSARTDLSAGRLSWPLSSVRTWVISEPSLSDLFYFCYNSVYLSMSFQTRLHQWHAVGNLPGPQLPSTAGPGSPAAVPWPPHQLPCPDPPSHRALAPLATRPHPNV